MQTRDGHGDRYRYIKRSLDKCGEMKKKKKKTHNDERCPIVYLLRFFCFSKPSIDLNRSPRHYQLVEAFRLTYRPVLSSMSSIVVDVRLRSVDELCKHKARI